MSSKSSPGACLVCGNPKCKLVSHRLAQLEVQRRVSRASERDKVVAAAVRHARKSLTDAVETPPSVHISPAPYEIDPFISLPVKGLKKSSIRLFQDFFTNQGFSVFDSTRSLGFDSALLPNLFPQAMQDPSLCMSAIAMASTYNAIHDRGLHAPDKEVLTVYNRCFQTLRRAVAKSDPGNVPESTIMAAINLVMCCGIGFGDKESAITHWNGVLALVNKQNPFMHSGPLIGFIQVLEYWLTLMAGLRPRDEEWRSPVSHERTIPHEYGEAFEELFENLQLTEDLAGKLCELCTNSCRAIGILEAFAKHPKPMPDTYFNYFRAIVADQNAKIYSTVRGSNTVAECISITLNIFFVAVLRVTPWKAPLQYLCSRLKKAFTKSGLASTWDVSVAALPTGEADLQHAGTRNVLRDMSIWVLCMCICASQLANDDACEEWALTLLFDAYKVEDGSEIWQVDILRLVRRFCWSDEVLSKCILKLKFPPVQSDPLHQVRRLPLSSP